MTNTTNATSATNAFSPAVGTYSEGRFIHDADSHIMETPDWIENYLDPQWRGKTVSLNINTVGRNNDSKLDWCRAANIDPAFRAEDKTQLMLRKNWAGLGSFVAEDRPTALDLLGFASQLVFNTFASIPLATAEHHADPGVPMAMSIAHNRAITDFCATDQRLLPVGYVSLAEPEQAAIVAQGAVDMGCASLMIASVCPKDRSPSHIAFDRVWGIAQDAETPIVLHVGGGGSLLSPTYFQNGMPPVPDFHGGAENFRSVDYMAIPNPPMQTLSALLFDGVFDRFPRLKWGVIEQGGSWLPGWMRNLDAAFGAFRKNEARLQQLSARPSEIVRRQVRVTPYPHEDTGWIIANAGPEVCMFSSDFPHVEGGRNPLKRFDESVAALDARTKQAFYSDNFADLMGDVLVRRGIRTTGANTTAGATTAAESQTPTAPSV